MFLQNHEITMPPRKPPKKLSASCTTVISNTILDVIVRVEQSFIQYSNNSLNTNSSERTGNISGTSDHLKIYYEKEYEIAKYLLSSIPNALISLVIIEIIKEFSFRWNKIIKLSENQGLLEGTNPLLFNNSFMQQRNEIESFLSNPIVSSMSMFDSILLKLKVCRMF